MTNFGHFFRRLITCIDKQCKSLQRNTSVSQYIIFTTKILLLLFLKVMSIFLHNLYTDASSTG